MTRPGYPLGKQVIVNKLFDIKTEQINHTMNLVMVQGIVDSKYPIKGTIIGATTIRTALIKLTGGVWQEVEDRNAALAILNVVARPQLTDFNITWMAVEISCGNGDIVLAPFEVVKEIMDGAQ